MEKTHLECKSWKRRNLKAFKEEVNQIAGFLNTDGGLLILGTPDEQWIDPSDHSKGKILRPPFHGHVNIEKDRLKNMLIDPIEPLPLGIEIETRPINDQPDKYVTIVDIPASEYPPHQVKGTYYVRLDGSTHWANHNIVKALFDHRSPQYQHVYIEHFKQKLRKYEDNRQVMAALYCLVLEDRPLRIEFVVEKITGEHERVEELVAYGLVRNKFEELVHQEGILMRELKDEYSEASKNPLALFVTPISEPYWIYGINANYRDLLRDAVFEMHYREPFELHV